MKAMAGMKRSAMGALVILLAASSAAMARPDTRTMSCQRVQTTIHDAGAIVMTTGQNTYDRFVSGNRYCLHPEVAWQTTVRARDTGRCPVKNCVNRNLVWPDDLFERFGNRP